MTIKFTHSEGNRMIQEALDKRANQGQGGQGGLVDRLKMAAQKGMEKLGMRTPNQ